MKPPVGAFLRSDADRTVDERPADVLIAPRPHAAKKPARCRAVG